MRSVRRIVALIIIVSILLSFGTTVIFGQVQLSDAQKKYLESNGINGGLSSYLTTKDPGDGNEPIYGYNDKDGYYVSIYKKPGIDDEQVVNALNMAVNNNQATSMIDKVNQQVEISADVEHAGEIASGFIVIFNILLGLGVVFITLSLAIFTAFDVCYIVFPVFQNKCEEAKTSGEGILVKTKANGERKLRFVSLEAQFAVKHCSYEEGKNPLVQYFSKRVVAYIIVAIILFIFLTGNISIITEIALKAVGGVMNVLQGLT